MSSPSTQPISRELALRKRLEKSLLAFSRDIPARPALDASLAALACEVNTLFGTIRTSLWLHDRRARMLRLAASSDRDGSDAVAPLSTEEDSLVARGLRHDGPQVLGTGTNQTLVVPLRGWRRALGTLVVEGQPRDLDEHQLVDLSVALARQLSSAIESVLVMDELIQQHRLLDDSFDSLADMVVVTNAESRVVQLNSALAARVSAGRADLADQPLEAVVGPAIAEWVASLSPRRGEIARQEFHGQPLADGIAATASPLVTRSGPAGLVLVLRDISDQVRLQERLVQAEKLASLGQFVAGIAHEMNNPLQSVLGQLELMLKAGVDNTAHRKRLRRAYDDADRAAKIVRDLLVFSGSRRVRRRRVNVERLLSRVIAMREGALQRGGVEIVREGTLDLPDVIGDPGLLQQALLNVLINGEQAMAETARPGQITVTTAVDQGVVVIAIADSGHGIPPDVLPRIFDPFYTTKEVGQGTGLGLAITYGIMQEHNGSITVSSSGGGAVFTLQLPIAE